MCVCFAYFDWHTRNWIAYVCVMCIHICMCIYMHIRIFIYMRTIRIFVSTLHILIDTVEIANLFNIWFQKNPSLSDDIQMANWFDAQELTKYNWILHFLQIGKSFILLYIMFINNCDNESHVPMERQMPSKYLRHLIFLLCVFIWHLMVCGVKLVVCIFLIMSNEYSDILSTPRAPNLHYKFDILGLFVAQSSFPISFIFKTYTFWFHTFL